MLETMYEAPGVGLAAPQVGIQKRMFVYDINDGSGWGIVVNPTLTDHHGEWEYTEGCLSVPDLHWPILRPNRVLLTGFDVDGKPLSIEGDELLGRMFQHEVDHLDGILLLERLDPVQRKQAMRALRQRHAGPRRLATGGPRAAGLPGDARGGGAARCGPSSTPATTSPWWSAVPTAAGDGAGRSSPAR